MINIKKTNYTTTLEINNPNKKNALNKDFFSDLTKILSDLEEDENTKILIIRGKGENFCAGVDLNELIKFPSTIDAKNFALQMEKAMNKLFLFKKPTISLVKGFALGAGAGLILNTDISIFSESVRLGFPAVRIGAILPVACTKRLVAATGSKAAKDLLLTGKLIDAKEALRLNIANYVVKEENIEEKKEKIINQLLKASDTALELTKETINSYINTTNNLYSGDNFAYLYSTADWHQRIWNFLNKNKH